MLFAGLFVIFFCIGFLFGCIGVFISKCDLDIDLGTPSDNIRLSEIFIAYGALFALLSGIPLLIFIGIGIFKLGFWIMSLTW